MSDRFFATQDLTVEIDTEDTTLGSHTERRLYYIFTNPDGAESDPAYKTGLVTASSVMYAALDPLSAGTYRVWAESVNAAGKKCISGPAFIPAEARGTYRA